MLESFNGENKAMSMQTVESLLHEAERLSFSEQLTLIQRLLDGLRKPPQTTIHPSDLPVHQHLQQVLARPARRELKSLELNTRGFQFNREAANER
jgi:hypothetical protein